MIRSFADKQTMRVYHGERPKGFPHELADRTEKILERINAARALEDLRVPPSHRLHALHGDQLVRWSISVNRQFRITFRFETGDAFDVRFEDYH